LVENNLDTTPEAKKIAHEYLDPLVKENIDALILGCTHYPLMADLIQEVVGPDIQLINSAEEIAAEVEEILITESLVNPLKCGEPWYRFFVSGNPKAFEEVGTKLLLREVKAYQVQL
jgi:glutamate racemase